MQNDQSESIDRALETIPYVGDYLAHLHRRLSSGTLLPQEADELALRIDALASLNDDLRIAKGLLL